MALRYTAETIETGMIPDTKGTILTVGAGERLLLTRIDLIMDEGVTDEQSIVLYINRGGASSKPHDRTLLFEAEHAIVPMSGIVLVEDDLIEAETTDADSVYFEIHCAKEAVT